MTMRALTIWRPWTDAILRWPGDKWKKVENRGWFPAWAVGETIAIHGGKRYDHDAVSFIEDLAAEAGIRWGIPPEIGTDSSPTGIVGTVRFCGVIDRDPKGRLPYKLVAGRFPEEETWCAWWMGGIGWLFENRVHLPQPIPCKGAQGLWKLPPDVESAVLHGMGEAPCPHPDRNGHHEWYVATRNLYLSMHCRACGALGRMEARRG